jgi:hypothetical protein
MVQARMPRLRILLLAQCVALGVCPFSALAQDSLSLGTSSVALDQHLANILAVDGSAGTRNAAAIDFTADTAPGVAGVSERAGAFNVQSNSVALDLVPAHVLAESAATIRQHAEQNLAIHQGVSNDVSAWIRLDGASGMIGINVAAGIGNLQINSAAVATR